MYSKVFLKYGDCHIASAKVVIFYETYKLTTKTELTIYSQS